MVVPSTGASQACGRASVYVYPFGSGCRAQTPWGVSPVRVPPTSFPTENRLTLTAEALIELGSPRKHSPRADSHIGRANPSS